jgi:ammonium transporter, Amt family
MTIYDSCNAAHDGDLQATLKCFSNWIETGQPESESFSKASGSTYQGNDYVRVEDLRNWLLILTGATVFFMQAGFAMICAGAVRKKNLNNTMLKNLLDACGSGLAFYAFGYGFAFGDNADSQEASFIGKCNFFLTGDSVDSATFFYQFAFSATAATIVAGALAERCKMVAYLSYSIMLTGFVYPVVAHNICR